MDVGRGRLVFRKYGQDLELVGTWYSGQYNRVVKGKSTDAFILDDGRKVKGGDLVNGDAWPWRQSLDAPGCRYARLRAKSATYGEVTLILVDKAGEDRFYVFCLTTPIRATRLLRVWSRRHLIERNRTGSENGNHAAACDS